MREWLSWWSTTLPRSGSRVRVPSRALAMKIAYAAVAQSVERRIGSAEVTGPIPVSSSLFESAGSLIFQGIRLFLIPLLYYFLGSSRVEQISCTLTSKCFFHIVLILRSFRTIECIVVQRCTLIFMPYLLSDFINIDSSI